MANHFYARYIPRKQEVPETESGPNLDQPQSVKRRKIKSYSKAVETIAFKTNEQEHQDLIPIKTHGLVPIPQPAQTLKKVQPTFSSLPEWLAHPKYVSSTECILLDTLPLNQNTLASLRKRGYERAFAIQKAVIPLLLRGANYHPGDICIAAATGSGKTLAYALPMIEDLRDKLNTRLRGLVIVPTRELVAQARDTFETCGGGSGLKIATAFGSKSLKEEQDLIIETERKFDPDTYQKKQRELVDEEEELLNWDLDDLLDETKGSECPIDHVMEYVSKVDVLICTPGRLVDHMQSTKGFTLNYVQWLVVDEADRLLDESFQQWVDIVIPALEYQAPPDQLEKQLQQTFHISRQRKVKKIILSATMTQNITKLTSLKLKRPMMIVLETTSQNENHTSSNGGHLESRKSIELPPTLKETAIPIKNAEDKPLHLIKLLEVGGGITIDSNSQPQEISNLQEEEKTKNHSASDSSHDDSSSDESSPNSSISTTSSNNSKPSSISKINCVLPSTHGVLVFTNNNENALRLARLLTLLRPTWGSQVGTLTKSSATSSGRKSLSAFRNHKISVLIASDRASRGLDIPDLSHVINYDMPIGVTSYIHRVGRTARAGKEGLATTLVSHHEARWFWKEIAKSKDIVRGPGKKMGRVKSDLEIGEKDRKVYQDALKLLGQETSKKRVESS